MQRVEQLTRMNGVKMKKNEFKADLMTTVVHSYSSFITFSDASCDVSLQTDPCHIHPV